MKQSRWKRWLSHLTSIHLESVDSKLNPGLFVCYSRGQYQLVVNNAIYSYGDRYDNYFDTFQKMDISKFQDSEILILGFGMGSIPYMLEKSRKFKANFTGVEFDETVIYLYNKYVADEIRSSVQLVSADAEIFMKLNNRKFDLIAMDVFVDDEIPEKFYEVEFIEYLKKALKPDGLIIWNHLYHHEEDRKRTDDFFESKFSKVFKKASFVQTRGNKMLLNKKIVNSQPKVEQNVNN